jgi:hypothetical protein
MGSRATGGHWLEPPVGSAVDTAEDGAAGDDSSGKAISTARTAHERQRHGLDTAQSVPRRNFTEVGRKRPFTNVPIWNHASRYKHAQIGSGADGTPNDQSDDPGHDHPGVSSTHFPLRAS